MRFFQRHQLAKVTFVRIIPVGDSSLWFLQRSPWVVDRHGKVRTALTVVLKHAEAVTTFNGFQAVVDAVTATDWNEAVQNVVEVCRRDLINREVTVVNAPFREVGRNHFIGMLRERFVVLLERRIQRQQVATVGVSHNNQLTGAFRTAAGITDFNLFLITPAFFHFKRCRARRTGCAGPYGLSVQQNFRRSWRITTPDVPLNFYIHAIVMHFDKIVIILCSLIHFHQGKFVIAIADRRCTWRCCKCGAGCRRNKERQIFWLHKFHFYFLINLFIT